MKFKKIENWAFVLASDTVRFGFIMPHNWNKNIKRSSLVCAISWVFSYNVHYDAEKPHNQLCILGFNYAKLITKTK
jgi:hypothetical protein